MNKFAPLHAVLALASLALVSCQSDVIFEKHRKLGSDYTWHTSDTVEITIPVTDNSGAYILELAFRCATGFPYDRMPVRVEEIAPNSKLTMRDVDVQVRNADGTFAGDKGFDIIDLTTVLDSKKTYPVHGDYRYRIYPRELTGTIDFAMEVGLVLRKPAD